MAGERPVYHTSEQKLYRKPGPDDHSLRLSCPLSNLWGQTNNSSEKNICAKNMLHHSVLAFLVPSAIERESGYRVGGYYLSLISAGMAADNRILFQLKSAGRHLLILGTTIGREGPETERSGCRTKKEEEWRNVSWSHSVILFPFKCSFVVGQCFAVFLRQPNPMRRVAESHFSVLVLGAISS